MHKRRGEIDASLTRWCATEYGAWWLENAMKPNALLRVMPGQIIPVVHMIALGTRRIYIAPPARVGERVHNLRNGQGILVCRIGDKCFLAASVSGVSLEALL